MSRKQYQKMESLIPVYLAYLSVGILESDYYGIASRILWEYNNAKTDSEKDAMIQELLSTTIKFIEDHEPILRNEMTTAQSLREQANSKSEKKPLDKRISRLKNATAVTTRLRRKYLASTSYSGEIPSSSGNAEIGQSINNSDGTCDAEVQKENMPRRKLELETKPVRSSAAQTMKEFFEERSLAGDRSRAEKLAESKSKCLR
jgi:hypothetical protein